MKHKSIYQQIQTNLENAAYETKIAIAHLLIKRIDIDKGGENLKVLVGLPVRCAEMVGLRDVNRIY